MIKPKFIALESSVKVETPLLVPLLAALPVCACMAIQRHWPGLSLSICRINYFGIPSERRHEHEDFHARVLDEFIKIPRYLAEGFLEEIGECAAYPQLDSATLRSVVTNERGD